jgi:hypothetical protein
MNFGLNANILTPPYSAILSILMVTGIDWLGLRVAYIFDLLGPDAPAWHRWQAPVIGAMLLSVLLYPLALAGMTPRWCFQAIGIGILAFGAWHAFLILKNVLYKRWVSCSNIFQRAKSLNGWHLILIALLVSMGITSLAAITNADSLDYHIGVAISLLNNGSFPVTPEWFDSRLAGSGEVLNALGLSIGAEQFGSLLQFAGVIAITGLLFKSELPENATTNKYDPRPVLTIAAVSAPVLLFLVSSPKPQLLHIAMTSLAVALVFYPSRRELTKRATISGFALICLLIMTASQAKFSFMLSGGIIGVFSFYVMMRRKLYIPAILVSLFIAALVLGPPTLWKYYHFGGEPLDSLFMPFPGNWPGYDKFEFFLRNYTENSLFFPLSLLIPSGIGVISTIIGAGLLVMLWLRPGRDLWIWGMVIMSLLVTILGALFGQQNSRFFLEPYYWILMAVSISPAVITSGAPLSWLKWPVAIQAVMVTGIWLFGLITLAPSAISQGMRDKIMNRSADGYTVMQWADEVLPIDAVLLSNHRSVALAPRDVVSMDWSYYVQIDSKEAIPYLLRIKERNVTHVLIMGNPREAKLKECFGDLVAGPSSARFATRNPINRGEPYAVWIYKFNSADLPDCAIGNGDNKLILSYLQEGLKMKL